MSDPTRAVTVDPAHAAQVVSDFAGSVGLPTPTTAGEVVEMLTRIGYDCTPRTLAEFVEKGYISDPGDVWGPVEVYVLAAALECRRRWLPTPNPRHDLKKSGFRLEIERLRAEGVDPPVRDLDDHSIEDLLLQLCQCDQRAVREALYETVRLKLDGFEE